MYSPVTHPKAVVMAIAMFLTLGGCSHRPLTGDWTSGAQPKVLSFRFETVPPGHLPPDFVVTQTNGGQPPHWAVQKDPQATSGSKVLAQLNTDTTRARFPLCIYENLNAKDLDVSVQYRAISGRVDEAAGIVVRFQDKDNYYVARANAIEDNFRFYKVQAGKRTQLATAALKTTSNRWYTLRLKVIDDHFEVYHDGRKMLDVQDDTFPQAGKVGLWTKADSVTHFDNLSIAVLP